MSLHLPAVQEERQRGRERAESEAEGASGGHEDMPVERILEAELAVEPKTEAYGDVSTENSVGGLAPCLAPTSRVQLEGGGVCESPRICPPALRPLPDK